MKPNRHHHRYTSERTWSSIFFFLFIITLSILTPPTASARLEVLENDDLGEICGTGGFTYAVKNFQIFQFIDTYRYCATDSGYIQFDNIKLHDGANGPAKLNFDFGTITKNGTIFYDVFEPTVASVNDWSGNNPTSENRLMSKFVAPWWDQDVAYTIGNFTFSDGTDTYDLGQIEIGPIDMPSFEYYISPRANGVGVDFESDFQTTVEQFTYAYQINSPNCKSLSFENIYFGESFADLVGDDPADPSTWKPNNNTDFGMFKIGDLFGDITGNTPSNPAMIDVGEGDIYGTGTDYGAVVLRLSMFGSIRFESAQFDTADFGPGAIDGLAVHRLDLKLIP